MHRLEKKLKREEKIKQTAGSQRGNYKELGFQFLSSQIEVKKLLLLKKLEDYPLYKNITNYN